MPALAFRPSSVSGLHHAHVLCVLPHIDVPLLFRCLRNATPFLITLPIIILSTIYDPRLLPQSRPKSAVALFGKQ